MDASTSGFYDRHAADIAAGCEAARSATSARFAEAFRPGGRVLDVGAGSGRDVAELLRQGFEAFGVEPNATLRALAMRRHPALADRLATGSLPELGAPFGGGFDGIVCSAVLMHIGEEQLTCAAQALCGLLKPAGRLLFTLPAMRADLVVAGRDPDGRVFVNHPPEQVRRLMAQFGCRQVGEWINDAVLESAGTRWFTLLFERGIPPSTTTSSAGR
jgi:SAM-dependent methyltransferase